MKQATENTDRPDNSSKADADIDIDKVDKA